MRGSVGGDVHGVKPPPPGDAEVGKEATRLASAVVTVNATSVGDPVDLDAVSQFTKVLRTPPVCNYQTVYGVIMVPSKQLIIPVN